jgi:hypothetical protein
MQTETFRRQIGKFLILAGALVICQPAFAQHVSTLLPGTESGGIEPVSYSSSAQNSQSLSTIHIPDLEPMKQNRFVSAEKLPSRRSWVALSAVVSGAAAFDAYSTRDAISHGAVEDDPLMRPFVHTNAIYAASQVSPMILDFVARRMQRSSNGFVRHIWWVPQSAATAEYIFCGVHNLHVAGQP